MTHTTMTSILNHHPMRTSSRTSAKSNNYWVEVVDTDNESHEFAVEARNEDEANRSAAQRRWLTTQAYMTLTIS